VAHELGHGFTEQLMNKLAIQINGAATEVIADLGAAWLLFKNGTPWTAILHAVRHGVQSGIFDVGWVHDHPPGSERAAYVEQFYAHMSRGHSFGTAVAMIANSANGRTQQNPGQAFTFKMQRPSKWGKFKSAVRGAVRGSGQVVYEGTDNIRD